MITSLTKVSEDNLLREKAIELTAISKKFPSLRAINKNAVCDFDEFWALRDVSLEVYQGQILGIIGRNGAGKTTLLNIMAGVLSPTHGEISVKGKVLGLFNLGVGFQDELTGKENIFLNGAIMGASKKELDTKLPLIIDFSELGDFINMPLGVYSQGMRLRLGFSIVANLDFDILVIDEILAVGDALFQNKCFSRIMDFKRAGKTLVITNQSMELIERLCDKVALLDHGQLLFYGDVTEGINRYRALLNTEKFFVGPLPPNPVLIENTKKWADDTSEWGKKYGTQEVVIESVKFMNKFGIKCNKIKSRDLLKVRVNFLAKNKVKDVHFGVAIFRNDGVYCYGPNTAFDGYQIPEIRPGKGWFVLNIKSLLLAPGEYRLSVAVWDKNETLAFDYHCGYYRLIVKGSQNINNELLNINYKWNMDPNPPVLDNNQRPNINNNNDPFFINSVKILDCYDREKEIFFTNEPVKISINYGVKNKKHKANFLWVGIYRSDGIYCQGFIKKINLKRNEVGLFFPKFALLPGFYKVSVGIWDALKKEFVVWSNGDYPLKLVFNKEDHGTVYLEHRWKWRLPDKNERNTPFCKHTHSKL